ncbi:glycosyltransferase involved in cell wall biosynthesis [Pseudomonas sp. AG1028]|uniref:glycosyltransferase n=1 Tax=Pseudomonas sp. AG1028 TaxID=2572911 RepID=UPI0011AD7F23|nr:glycosyltransferase [Pseudomonas sp. AG1028]TWE09699.1 glycosyltransferase involved in cell wall biosynthesis [Pseudomonas sp. AG1028]
MPKLEHKIVVTIPVYNEGPYILQTLESVAAQTYSDFQVLIADNASTDETERVCRDFCARDARFHYARHESNLGATANFKYCFDNTESELFMWLGGHDMLHPEFLQEACSRMEADSGLSLVYSQTQWINEHNQVLGHTNGGNYVFQEPLTPPVRFIKMLNALDRCEAINQIIRRKFVDLPFRPIVSADLVFLCHLAAHGPFARIERPLYIRREISKRTSTMMERITGKRIAPQYEELAAFFTESICSHRDIAPAAKPQLISDTLTWLNNRFSIFTPAKVEPITAVQTDTPAPFFSVIMPVYNRERYVREAIDSVLTQDDGDFELIVVDDGSTDRSVEVIRTIHDPRIRLLHNKHGGGASARNRGLAEARGQFVVWIDSDDRQAKRALSEIRRGIMANPDCDVFYGDLEIFDDLRGQRQALRTNYPDYQGQSLLPLLIQGNCLPNPGTAVRRSLYETYGGYDLAFTRCHDYQIWTRLADTAGFKKVDAIVCHWRQHDESLSSAKTKAFEGKVILDAFARYPVNRLFPDLDAGSSGQAQACWRVSQTLQALGEHAAALHVAYQASALGEGIAHNLSELERLAGRAYEPLFSIILTTYNRPDLLKDALSSVGSQTLRDFEVILINDNGEPVEHLLADYAFPITYVRQGRNQGLSAARNAGLTLARGRYVVYLDDDDIYLPNHLAVLAKTLEQHPDSVVYTGVEYVNEKVESGQRIELGRSQPFKHEAFDRDLLFVQNYIPVNTWAHPRTMLAAVGNFDTGLSAFEDWDMLLRLAARYQFVHVPLVSAEVHLRDAPNTGSDHMLGREQKNFGPLYQEMYRRHGIGDNSAVCAERSVVLQRFGITVEEGRSAPSMGAWLDRRSLTPPQREHVAERLQGATAPQLAVVILDLQGDQAGLTLTLGSLARAHQNYEKLSAFVLTALTDVAQSAMSCQAITLANDDYIAPLNALLRDATFDWCLLVQAGDELTPSGLMMAGLELLTAPDCRAIYCDEMFRQDGQLAAALRPAFNLDYLLSFPAGMTRHWLFRRDVVVATGGFDPAFEQAAEFELILRLINEGGLDGLGHVAEPLVITEAPALADNAAEQRAITQHLQQRGYQNALVSSSKPGRYQIDYGHGQTPLVSFLIVPGERLEYLQRCVESILENTRYANYELLLIQSSLQADEVGAWLSALASLGEARIRVLPAGQEVLAPQALLNQAAEQAHGDYLLLLSADTAAISEDWLDELVNHAQRPEVACVGAKLLSADGKIARASLILGLEGPVGRPYVGEPLDAPGYMQRLQVVQNSSAVGHECLLVAKAVFLQLGGLSEEGMPWRYAGVDLCLKARQAGYLTVWTPFSQVMFDPVDITRGTTAEHDALYAKWLPVLARDPAYNPNFSLSQPGGFKLADTALSWRPLSSWKPVPTVLAHPSDNYGSGHYRVIQPFSALQQAGLIDGGLSPGLMHVTDLERYDPDVIILQKQIGDDRFDAMRRMQAFSRAFKVYELDDYLPNLPVKSVHRAQMPKDILKSMRRGLGYVDRFVVSTQALADACSGLHDDIRVIENCLPPAWWKGLAAKRNRSQKPRVGWAGGIGHTGDLEMIADVVLALADEVDWVFMGMCPDKLRPAVKEVHEGVDISVYPRALAALNLDLAVAPLEENLFNECKSNLRLLEYGACGFAVVCSDVRSYQGDLPVTRVKNRYRDWIDAIRMHVADLDATARAGEALHQQVMRDWMLEGDNLVAWQRAWLPD